MRGASVEPSVDVVIIGAGIIGAATAVELGRRGYRTLNLEMLPAAGYGPTGHSCAIVRFHYSSRDGVAMSHEGSFYWKDWESYLGTADERGTARYRECGTILIKSRTGQFQKAVRHFDELRVPYDDWDAAELARRAPLFDVREFWPPRSPTDPSFHDEPERELDGAIFTPDAGYVVDPQLATHNLQVAAEGIGGSFRFNARVADILRDSGRVAGVLLDDGTKIAAPVVINVAGPHSALVNRMAGVQADMKVGTRPLRHEVHHVPAPPGFDFEADGVVTSDGDLGIYFRPDVANHILVGSEDPICDDREWVGDPERYDRRVTESQWEAQVFRLARRIPQLPIPTERRGIVSLYDVSDDWLPIYDRSSLDGFYMAIGTSGNQFKNAPVAGHIMAELVDRVENGHDHDCDPVRVRCRYSGAELDVGAYSRLRELTPESSFSVMG